MQPDSYFQTPEQLRRLWQGFMDNGRLAPENGSLADPLVVQSWRRCRPRLDFNAVPRPRRLAATSLASVLAGQAEMLAVAAPLLEDIYQYIEGSGSTVLLTDGASCQLLMEGDIETREWINRHNLGQGSYWSEEQLGTTALGLARLHAQPVQVVGAEHYYKLFHPFVSTAAPIHDVRGRVTALVGLFGPLKRTGNHSLALVMMAARAIGNQLQTEWYVEEANRHLTEVRTLLGAVSEGVVAWDEAGVIRHVNSQAGQVLRVNPRTIVGRPLQQVMPLPPMVAQAVAEQQEVRDVEVNLTVDGRLCHCLLSVRPIFAGQAEAIGAIALLRPIEQVRRLVHQQTGMRATISLDDVSSHAPSMKPVLRQARIAARGTAPVLLRGEGGSGKNYLARVIHNEGERAAGPFIAINCQAIPHELMIGEFLGYEEEGGRQGRPSKFELADGGTLLLDGLEHLSLEMQAALLHLIETGYVIRLGGARQLEVDVRIIAATTADLLAKVADGSFISHLYYRFGVFNILIPPLRDRPEDAPLLAERFLARISRDREQAVWIEDEAMEVLRRYPWPGNVRELESVLERAIHQSQDGTIRLPDLPPVVRHGRVITETSPEPQPVLSMEEVEREAIIRAGRACEGQVTHMARQLGISRTTLWRKMKHYHLTPETFKHATF